MSALSRYWVYISGTIAFVFFIIVALEPFAAQQKSDALLSGFDDDEAGSFFAPKQNIWEDLSKEEADFVRDYLFSKSGLNLTKSSHATSHDNTVVLVETLQPNKTDVLAYLNGTADVPSRWAHVVIAQGSTDEARLVNYMVGPLQSDTEPSILPLDYPYNSGRHYVVNPLASAEELQEWALSYCIGSLDVIIGLLGTEANPFNPENLAASVRAVVAQNESLIMWMQFYQGGSQSEATTLLPQGLYAKLDVSTRNTSNWKALQLYYDNVLYDSVSELRQAMASPDFRKIGLNLDGEWTTIEDFSKGPPERDLPPPTMVQPSHARFNIDQKERFVSWLGFEFFISTSLDVGATLHDINFNGDRVIYEIGLQEAMVHYAGNDPFQGGQAYLDTTTEMGAEMFELVPGYDCPAYATFLSTTFHMGESTYTNKNSICIFEYTADHALQRHTTDSRISISRNTYLVVRYVSTVANYDYTFDYIFYLDGTIEVKVRASGFIYAAHWAESTVSKDEYGFRVHDALQTSIHDHVLNFKADLDVAGTDNTMAIIGIEPLTQKYPWEDEPMNTMHLVSRNVEKETGLDWPKNSEEILVVFSNSTNVWGEQRGYRIQPGTGMGTPSHLTILNSTSLEKSCEWASRDLWVLKRKDTEPRSSSPLSTYDTIDPLIDFSKFVDNESIEGEDLVIWFNLGAHHVPHSGDIPNTLMHTSSSSVMFTPFNFHDRDPSRRSAQGVRLELREKGTKPKYFGGRYKNDVVLKETDLEPDLSQYNGTPSEAVGLPGSTGILVIGPVHIF